MYQANREGHYTEWHNAGTVEWLQFYPELKLNHGKAVGPVNSCHIAWD